MDTAVDSLRCPVCQKQAAKGWEIFFAPFWIARLCRHCRAKLKLNYDTMFMLFGFMVAGIIVATIVDKLFSVEADLFSAALVVIFTLVPIFLGKRLFAEKNIK